MWVLARLKQQRYTQLSRCGSEIEKQQCYTRPDVGERRVYAILTAISNHLTLTMNLVSRSDSYLQRPCNCLDPGWNRFALKRGCVICLHSNRQPRCHAVLCIHRIHTLTKTNPPCGGAASEGLSPHGEARVPRRPLNRGC